MPNVQEQVEIYIQEDMDVSKRSWLVATLENKKEIISAWLERGNHHLTICFEWDKYSHITL